MKPNDPHSVTITGGISKAGIVLSGDCYCCGEIASSFWGLSSEEGYKNIYSLCGHCCSGLWSFGSWEEQEATILDRKIAYIRWFHRKRKKIIEEYLKEEGNGISV